MVEQHSRPYLVGVEFLYADYGVLVVVVCIEVGGVELPSGQKDEDAVVAVELAQVRSLLVIIEPLHVVVEPHLSSSQRAASVALQRDSGHLQFRQSVSYALPALDGNLGEVLVEEHLVQLGIWL